MLSLSAFPFDSPIFSTIWQKKIVNGILPHSLFYPLSFCPHFPPYFSSFCRPHYFLIPSLIFLEHALLFWDGDESPLLDFLVEGGRLVGTGFLLGRLFCDLDCANLDWRVVAGVDEVEGSILGKPNDTTSLSITILVLFFKGIIF